MGAKLICFVGVDGSGKSTQINLLRQSITKKGLRCRSFWLGWIPYVSSPLRFFTKKRGYTKREYYRSHEYTIPFFYKNKLLAFLFPFIMLFDYLYLIYLQILPRKINNDYLLLDRYAYEIIIRMHESSRLQSLKRFFIWLIPHIFPKPDYTILIDINERTVENRKPEFPSSIIKERRQQYLKLAEKYGFFIIKGIKSKEKINQAIEKIIFR
jgi:thymidylate kinase